MTKPQDIIDLIDVGLQTPAPDPTYGEVSPSNRESCARCHRPPANDSDWCEGCRAYLLGDRDDPREELRAGAWPEYMQGRWPTSGDAPAADSLYHICGNPRCVNPDHLERVTHRENVRSGFLWWPPSTWPCQPEPVHPSAHYHHVHVSVPEQSAPPTTAEITAGAELIDIGARPWSDLPPGSALTYGELLPPGFMSGLQDVVERLGAVDPAFWTALEDVAEEPERLDDPDRRRHGHAAICPRHGETRGGTCRRCR
jgi:hypothetical protein